MKKVICKDELHQKILEATQILADAVKHTLGPKGCNCLIRNRKMAPFITNDGVTIAQNINSEDPVIDTILDILKESTLKTNELVGDGTTSTIVLLESMIKDGLETIRNGYNPQVLKKEMTEYIPIVLNELAKFQESSTKKEYQEVATSSCNEEALGNKIYEAYQIVEDTSAIHLKESNKKETYFERIEGYTIDTSIPNELLKNNVHMIENPQVLILSGTLDSLEKISSIINLGIQKQLNLLIFADYIQEEVSRELTLYNLENENKIIALEIPDYGLRKQDIMEDLAVLTNSKIYYLDYLEDFNWQNLGTLLKVEFTKETSLLKFKESVKVTNHLEKLQKTILITESEYEKSFLQERYAKLQNGIILFYVGGHSKTEIRERLMRAEDALCALNVTKKGVVTGGGITLLKMKENLQPEKTGEKIIWNAFPKIFEQIMENAGENFEEILLHIKKEHYQNLYNVKLEQFEKTEKSSVKEPIEVVKCYLTNAISIATMILTTSHLIVNEGNLPTNKIDLDF